MSCHPEATTLDCHCLERSIWGEERALKVKPILVTCLKEPVSLLQEVIFLKQKIPKIRY